MHRLLKWATFALALIAGLLLLAVLSILIRFPDAGQTPQVSVEGTPEQIERGRYLTHNVTVCADCHSERDFGYFAGPVKQETIGQGGERFDRSMGLPGVLIASNITPSGIGDWSDGEILHAITTGVTRDGRALFPLMPYQAYGTMAQQDAEAIVAYLRTLPAIEHETPVADLDFPMNIITRTIPAAATPGDIPDPGDQIAYGRYMTTIAACAACHTPLVGGQPDNTRAYAGGHEYRLPSGTVRASNITPHADSGIGGWTREQFIARFRSMEGRRDRVGPNSFNTVMPWLSYAGMTDDDLGAIFAYLQTVPAVDQTIVRFTPNP